MTIEKEVRKNGKQERGSENCNRNNKSVKESKEKRQERKRRKNIQKKECKNIELGFSEETM